jgi:hypothetical protein
MSEQLSAGRSANNRRPWWVQIGLRFPFLYGLIVPIVLRLPLESPFRRRLIKLAFRAAWGGINRGDSEPARLVYERDAEVCLFGAEGLGLAERYYGEGGWTEFIGDIFENFAEPRFTTQRVRDGGDRLVAEIGLTASGKVSGFPVVNSVGTVYYLSSRGKIARQEVFWQHDSWNLALGAAGMSE